MEKIKYNYSNNMSNEAIREVFNEHWEKIPCLSKTKIKVEDLQRELLDFHVKNGGKNKIGAKAVTRMLIEFSKKNPDKVKRSREKGFWEINFKKRASRTQVLKAARPIAIRKDNLEVKAKEIFGVGKYFVYVFFDNKTVCKIGKTTNVSQRFKSLSTGWHEQWSHPYQIRLKSKENMLAYEKAIHSILEIKGFKINGQNERGGKELFKISAKKLKPYISKLNWILQIK
jgi:hypothetical protein